jgi:hypothetical protein
MVWKFGSTAAQENHAKLISRLEPTRRDAAPAQTPTAPAPAVEALASVSGLSTPRTDGRVEPVLQAQEAFLAEHNIRVEPSLPVIPDGVAELQKEPVLEVPGASVEEPVQQAPSEPAMDIAQEPTVLEGDLPSDVFSWSVPGFEGDPDELPDLRPLPPPPKEHPGLQHRNVNTFGHALRFPAEDERQELWAEQRRDRGFDDTELWGLDDTFARFILPRLKALRQQKLEPPSKTMELTRWYSLLDKMIRAFELLLPEGGGAWSRGTLNDRERAQLQDGLDLFRKYFFHLCL